MKPYKFRKSESNISPKLVEYLQDGILIRFHIKSVTKTDEDGKETTMFKYKEFWFDVNTTNIADVVSAKGFTLTKKYKNLLK